MPGAVPYTGTTRATSPTGCCIPPARPHGTKKAPHAAVHHGTTAEGEPAAPHAEPSFLDRVRTEARYAAFGAAQHALGSSSREAEHPARQTGELPGAGLIERRGLSGGVAPRPELRGYAHRWPEVTKHDSPLLLDYDDHSPSGAGLILLNCILTVDRPSKQTSLRVQGYLVGRAEDHFCHNRMPFCMRLSRNNCLARHVYAYSWHIEYSIAPGSERTAPGRTLQSA